MYYINKIVGFLVSPIGIAILGGVLSILLAVKHHGRLAKWLGGLTIAWLWLWMTPLITWVVGAPLEREFLVDGKISEAESFPEADAIILLGGSMGIDTNLSAQAEMWTSADRVWQAARLYKARKAPKIVATGDSAELTTSGLLKDLGVVSEDVSFLPARNTEGEAKAIATLGYKRILLVTSAWHMKRARLMFEMYAPGVEVICAPADFENTMAARRKWYLLPDFNALALNSVSFHELVGLLGYKLFR